jgi:hypothetical protein
MNQFLICLLAVSLYAVTGYAQEAVGAGAPNGVVARADDRARVELTTSIECADGTSRTCRGTTRSGNDDTATQRGYCTCGTPDTKQCPSRGGIAMEEGDY